MLPGRPPAPARLLELAGAGHQLVGRVPEQGLAVLLRLRPAQARRLEEDPELLLEAAARVEAKMEAGPGRSAMGGGRF